MILAVALALPLAGCWSTPAPSKPLPTPDPTPILGHQGSGVLHVEEVRWLPHGHPKPQQGHYVSIRLTWRATEGNLSINPARLFFEDTRGNIAPFVYTGPDVSPVLTSQSLTAGTTATGWASFDVAMGDGHLIVKDEANDEVARIPIEGH